MATDYATLWDRLTNPDDDKPRSLRHNKRYRGMNGFMYRFVSNKKVTAPDGSPHPWFWIGEYEADPNDPEEESYTTKVPACPICWRRCVGPFGDECYIHGEVFENTSDQEEEEEEEEEQEDQVE